VGRTQKQDGERGIDEQAMFHRVVLCLAALTRRLFSSVLGADAAPFGAVMGNREDACPAAGAAATGAGSSNGAATVAASASETPSCWAKAVRDWAGAAPRGRSAASSAGRRTCIYCLALLWPIPHTRPWTTWSAEVFRDASINKSRSSGVGKGQVS
jgi:hypothetical protein